MSATEASDRYGEVVSGTRDEQILGNVRRARVAVSVLLGWVETTDMETCRELAECLNEIEYAVTEGEDETSDAEPAGGA